MIELKTCTKCGSELPMTEFCMDRQKSDGLACHCNACRKKVSDAYYGKHREKVNKASRLRRKANPERTREDDRRWKKKNSERLNESSRSRYAANPERGRENSRRCYYANHERSKEMLCMRAKKHLSTPKGKLNSIMSNGINQSIRTGAKAGRHWETLVEYTIDGLKSHLEKQFTREMNWGNQGSYWHIDHKIPIAVFNFETPEDIDFKRCWALKNLQPLEAVENIKKGAMIDRPFQPSLLLRLSA